MPVLTTSSRLRIGNATTVSDDAARLTITGIDITGQMFRRPAEVVKMDRRDCAFRCDRQVEPGGSILIEIDCAQANPTRQILHAIVKSTAADGDTGFYISGAELEGVGAEIILPTLVPTQPVAVKSPLAPTASVNADSAGNVGSTATAPEPISQHQSSSHPPVPPVAKDHTTVKSTVEIQKLPAKSPSENLAAHGESVKSAVAPRIEPDLNLLRSLISSELQRIVPMVVSSTVEKMVRDVVAAQLSASHEASAQTFNAGITRQIEDRISDLRASLDATAKKLIEEQTARSRTAENDAAEELTARAATIIHSFKDTVAEMAKAVSDKQSEVSQIALERAEQAVNSHVATLVRSFHESAAEIEARIEASRAAAETVLATSRAHHQEIKDAIPSLEQVLELLNNSNTSAMQNFQVQISGEMNRRAAQFENQIDEISRERAIGFSKEIEIRSASNQQQADELFAKLSAAFQLLQSTARVQQERLTEHSKNTTANFEKEIKSILLRFAGGESSQT